MKLSAKNNKLLIPLLIGAIILWAMIIYRIYTFYYSSGEDEMITNYESNQHKYDLLKNEFMPEIFNYAILDKDPFLLGIKKKDTTIIKTVQELAEEKPVISFSIKGVILNGNNRTVILQDDTNNKTMFLKIGEEYNGIKIKGIFKDKVQLSMNKKVIDVNI